jgi:hypothetical protein
MAEAPKVALTVQRVFSPARNAQACVRLKALLACSSSFCFNLAFETHGELSSHMLTQVLPPVSLHCRLSVYAFHKTAAFLKY